MHGITKKPETESLTIFEWFENNYLKANSGRLPVTLTTYYRLKINVGGTASYGMKQL